MKDPRKESRTEIETALTDQAASVAVAIFYAGPEATPVAYARDSTQGRRVWLTAAGKHGRLETTWSVEQARELFQALGVVLMAEEIAAESAA